MPVPKPAPKAPATKAPKKKTSPATADWVERKARTPRAAAPKPAGGDVVGGDSPEGVRELKRRSAAQDREAKQRHELEQADQAELEERQRSGRPVKELPKIDVSDGAGFVLGLVAYALFLNYLRGGVDASKGWLAAKFLNRPYTGNFGALTPTSTGAAAPVRRPNTVVGRL